MRRLFAWLLFVVSVAWVGVILDAPHAIAAERLHAGIAQFARRYGGGLQELRGRPPSLQARLRPWRAGVARTTYAIGSLICHQRPERAFSVGAVPYPVCARCQGLYLAAPFGVFLAILAWRRRNAGNAASPTMTARSPATTALATTALATTGPGAVRDPVRRWRVVLLAAAVPTILSVAIEAIGGPTSGASRFLTALPLGATVAAVVAAALLGLDRASATLTSRWPNA
jgi:hypothetical protein